MPDNDLSAERSRDALIAEVRRRAARRRLQRRAAIGTVAGLAVAASIAAPLALAGGGRPATINVIAPPTSSSPTPSTSSPAPTTTTTTTPTSTTLAPATFSWTAHTAAGLGGGFGDELSCPSINFCAAVAVSGSYPQTTQIGLMVFDGTTWTKPTAEPAFNDSLVALSCAEPTFCLAVSGNGVYTTWNGSAWASTSSTPLGKSSFASTISCPSPTFCMLLNGAQNANTGAGTTTYTTWRPTSGWSAVHALDNIDISSVSCLQEVFCMAAGQATTANANGVMADDIAVQWNGSSWDPPVKMTDPRANPPYGAAGIGTTGRISCITSDFCMIAGGYHASGDEYALWNGNSWSNEGPDTSQTRTSPEGFVSVSCPSTSLCVAIDGGSGANGSPSTFKPPAVLVWQTGSWSSTSVNLEGATYISCPSVTRCVIIGAGKYWIGTS